MNDSSSGAAAAGIGLIALVIWLAIIVLIVASMWKVFSKAGQPGWGCLIPIYNLYLLCKIAGKPGWWLLLMFIPIVGFVIAVMVVLGVSANFGKGGGFAVGLLLLPIVFYPILAFGDATYGPPAIGA